MRRLAFLVVLLGVIMPCLLVWAEEVPGRQSLAVGFQDNPVFCLYNPALGYTSGDWQAGSYHLEEGENASQDMLGVNLTFSSFPLGLTLNKAERVWVSAEEEREVVTALTLTCPLGPGVALGVTKGWQKLLAKGEFVTSKRFSDAGVKVEVQKLSEDKWCKDFLGEDFARKFKKLPLTILLGVRSLDLENIEREGANKITGRIAWQSPLGLFAYHIEGSQTGWAYQKKIGFLKTGLYYAGKEPVFSLGFEVPKINLGGTFGGTTSERFLLLSMDLN